MEVDFSRSERLRELDGWRAVSVMLVIVHHILGAQHHRYVAALPFIADRVHYFGPLGVNVFFVISGFVICRMFIAEEKRDGSVSLFGFYCRRFFRIIPALFAYLLAVTILFLLGIIIEHRMSILSAALFLRDLHLAPTIPYSWFVGHIWSLSVEEQFYLVFPTIWILTPKAWKGRAFFSVFLLCVLWDLSMDFTGWEAVISSDTRAGFACIAGGVLAAIHEANVRLAARRTAAVVAAMVGVMLLLHPADSNNWRSVIYDSIVEPASIVLILFFSLERKGLLRDFLCSKPVQAVGLTSYGIYLWQQLFTAPIQNYAGIGLKIPLLFPAIFLIVPLSYFLVEKPCMAFGRGIARRAKSVSSVAESAAREMA